MSYFTTKDNLRIFYEEYGTGDKVILSAQVGFYSVGMQQAVKTGKWYEQPA